MRRLPTNRRPIHPGEVFLQDFLRPLGITQKEAARRLRISYPRMNEIVNGKRSVTPETALRLGRFTDTEPEFWLNLQQAVDLWDAQHAEGVEDIEKIRPAVGARARAVRERARPAHLSELEVRLRDWAQGSRCRLCVLFGSRGAGGRPVKGDVDVALDFPELPAPQQRLEIIGEIQALCGRPMADVVFLHGGTDPVLRFEIFRDGVPLYEGRTGLFVEEKVRALMLYEDALPFRRLLRERLRGTAEGARRVT